MYNHDRVRDILYRTRAENYEYPMPLGPIFHERISSFCHSKKVKDIIEKAYTGDTGLRCKLLKRIVDTISKFKLNEAGVLERNNQLETLLRYEYIEEVTIRRKLTTLLMAAEFIIDKKDFNAFYVAAMNDYKQYSVSEIAIREKNILSFSRGKNVFGKC